jgi:hypothetical protein
MAVFLITGAQCAISFFTCAASSAGVLATMVTRSFSNAPRTAGRLKIQIR